MKNPAKEYLESLGSLKRTIESIEERIRELDSRNTSVPGVRYDKLGVQVSPENRLEANVIAKVDLETSERLAKLKRRFELQYEIIILQLQAMDKPLHRDILLLRYVRGKEFDRIAYELHYSRDTIVNEHGKALQEFRIKFL